MRRRINLDFFTPEEVIVEEVAIDDDYQSRDQEIAELEATLWESMEEERRIFQEAQQIEKQMIQLRGELHNLNHQISDFCQ